MKHEFNAKCAGCGELITKFNDLGLGLPQEGDLVAHYLCRKFNKVVADGLVLATKDDVINWKRNGKGAR